MRKKYTLLLFSLITAFISLTANAPASDIVEAAAMTKGAKLSGDYPKLTVMEPRIDGEEGSRKVEWEISFSLGDNPAQWDRVLIGEILTNEIKRSPIRWRLTDESGNIWPISTSGPALEMSWLAPDTMGWGISPTEDMPFDVLKDKHFTIKLTALLSPASGASEAGREGVLNGAFINCYYNHILKNYNSSYTGTQAQNASTAFDRVSLYVNEDKLPETGTPLTADDSTYNDFDFKLPTLEYTPPEEPVYRMPEQAPQLPAAADSRDYRDLYVEGQENGVAETAPPAYETVPGYGSQAAVSQDPVYDPYSYVDKNALAPDFNLNPPAVEDMPALVDVPPWPGEISEPPQYRDSDASSIIGYDPSFEFNSEIEYPVATEVPDNIAFGSSFSYPQDDYPAEQAAPPPERITRGAGSPDSGNIAYGSAFSYPQNDVALIGEVSPRAVSPEPPRISPAPPLLSPGPIRVSPMPQVFPEQTRVSPTPIGISPTPAVTPIALENTGTPPTIAFGSEFSYPQGETAPDYSEDASIPQLPRVVAFPSRQTERGEAFTRSQAVTQEPLVSVTPPELLQPEIKLNLYNEPSAEEITPAARPRTRSSEIKTVSYDSDEDSESNPTTYDKSFIRNLYVYLFLCISIALMFGIKKQKR